MSDTDPIGTRILTVATPEGNKEVLIRLFAPVDRPPFWECAYQIDWPEGRFDSFAAGNDALHALHLAQLKIGTDLYMSRYHAEGRMAWLKPWIGYGFPVPKEARELLVGDDARFYGV